MHPDESAFVRKLEAIVVIVLLILLLVICFFRIRDLEDKLHGVDQKQDAVHLVVNEDTGVTSVTAPAGFHYEIADDGSAILVKEKEIDKNNDEE